MLNIPDEYQTGNKKMDEKIAKALAREGKTFSGIKVSQQFVDRLVSKKKNKYNVSDKSERTNGIITWDSKTEMEHWNDLLLVQRSGKIADLERQVQFILQEEFISKQYGEIRPIIYIADYVYLNISYRKGFEGRRCIEDSKTGVRTADYQIKRKIMLYKYAEYLFFEV